MLKFSIMVAVLLVSVGLYGSNMNLSYAQNQALSQSGNSEAEQEIEQAQSLSQDAQCVSGEVTALSCNNLGLQVQSNSDGEEPNGEEPPNTPGDTTICHFSAQQGGQYQTLNLSENAAEAHLEQHELDHPGPCTGEEPLPR